MMAFFTLIYIGYLIFYPFKTVDYVNTPFPVLNPNKTVQMGDAVRYRVSYCRYTPLVTNVTRLLENDIIYNLTSGTINTPVGCGTTVNTVLIPKGVIPGIYRIVSTATWRLNPLREINKTVETESFTVTE
jgi:hypothetical protein